MCHLTLGSREPSAPLRLGAITRVLAGEIRGQSIERVRLLIGRPAGWRSDPPSRPEHARAAIAARRTLAGRYCPDAPESAQRCRGAPASAALRRAR
jgi:hypothetical protein